MAPVDARRIVEIDRETGPITHGKDGHLMIRSRVPEFESAIRNLASERLGQP